MVGGKGFGHFFQKGEKVFGMVVAGIPAGDKYRVESFAISVKVVLFFEESDLLGGIGNLKLNGNPDPVIEVVLGTKFAEFEVHIPPWNFHEGGIVGILKGDVFHGVCSENGHFPKILVKLGEGPSIPTVGAGTIAYLVTTQRNIGGKRTRELRVQPHAALSPIQSAKQFPDTKHHAPTVGAKNFHNRRGLLIGRCWNNTDAKTFGFGGHPGFVPDTKADDGPGGFRGLIGNRPFQASSLGDFLGKDVGGNRLGGGTVA